MAVMQTAMKMVDEKQCPTWLKFLDEVTGSNAEAIETLRGFMALCLDPEKRCDYALVLAGEGMGKSTIRKVLTSLLPIGKTSCVPLLKIKDDILRYALKDSWLNWSVIVNPGDLDVSTYFKSILTGDPILARQLYDNPIEFTPRCKQLFETNDSCFENRRCHRIKFDYRPEVTDSHLFFALWEEADEIRRWVKEAVPEKMTTTCDHCMEEIDLDESRTCKTCGMTLCPECVCPECEA